MTGKSDKHPRFWTEKELKSWHPHSNKPKTSRDQKAAGTPASRAKHSTKGKRSS
jgi:hypothetical protein